MKMNRKSFLQLLAGLLSTTTAINKSQAEAWKPIIVEPLIDPELPPEPLLYAFTIHKLSSSGMRRSVRMLPVFEPVAGAKPVSSDQAEMLFADMIAYGKDFPHGRHFKDLAPVVSAYPPTLRREPAKLWAVP